MAAPRLRVPNPPPSGSPLARAAAAGLRRGRALPPDLHDAAALERRDAAAGARALAPLDVVEPARAGRLRGARPRRVPVRDPAAARRGCGGARDRHGPGGRGVRAPRHRPAGRLDAARGARAAAALVRRRQRHDGGAAGLGVGPRRPRPDARRLPDRVEQAARCGCAPPTGRAPARRPTRPSAPRCWAGPRTTGCSCSEAWGEEYVGAARDDGGRAAEPAHPDARRVVGRLRAHDAALVGAGARRARRALARGPADVLRLVQPALDGQPAVGDRAPARGRAHRVGRGRRARRPARRAGGVPRRAHRRLVGELPLLLRSGLLRGPAGGGEGAPLGGGARGRDLAHLVAHRAARLGPGDRAGLARPALAGPAPGRRRRRQARALPGRDHQHRVPARPRRLQHPARDHRGARHAARRLHPRQGGDAERRRRRRDDLLGHPRRALGLDLLARQRVLGQRHRART